MIAMRKVAKVMIAVLVTISILSCQHQEDLAETSNEIKAESFYNLFEEGMNTILHNTYKDITINTSFSDMSNMFKTNSKSFFAKKGFKVTHDEIIQSRSVNMSQLSHNNNLKENYQPLVDEILEIMQSPDYNYVRLEITQLHNRILNIIQPNERIALLQYVEFIETMLDFMENEKGKFDVMNTFVRYNEFHEFEFSEVKSYEMPITRQSIPDGKYPHQEDSSKFILITNNHYYICSCASSLLYSPDCQCCSWDVQASGGSSWWNAWGKCLAAIIGGAGSGALAGGSGGSVLPGVGTAAGAIAGTIFGGLLGAVAGC